MSTNNNLRSIAGPNENKKMVYLLRFHGEETNNSGDDIVGLYETMEKAKHQLNENLLGLDIDNEGNHMYDLLFGEVGHYRRIERVIEEKFPGPAVDKIMFHLLNDFKLTSNEDYNIYNLLTREINHSEIMHLNFKMNEALDTIFSLYDDLTLSSIRRLIMNQRVLGFWYGSRIFFLDIPHYSIWVRSPYKFDLERDIKDSDKLSYFVHCFEITPIILEN